MCVLDYALIKYLRHKEEWIPVNSIGKISDGWIRDIESVWIELILLKLKTENWIHCSKIIFKCVNSTVNPFLMKRLIKRGVCGIREQCTSVLFTEDRVNHCDWKEKKEKKLKKHRRSTLSAIQTSAYNKSGIKTFIK